jgi:plastocyanin
MDQLWSSLLQFIGQLVSPDWGALVALVPILVLLLVGLWLAWTVVRFAKAGPTRRGKRRLTPQPPAGVHAGEQSWAPVFASVGMMLLLFGLVFEGPLLLGGVAVLNLALLFWLREGMRDYEHVEHPTTGVVALPPQTPPPGIHMPGPSFRPILASIAMMVLFYGLVFGGWLLLAGALMLVISLLQWLTDARREYRGVVVADETGHLPADPIPAYPRGTLVLFGALFLGAIVLNSGILPPQSAVGGTNGGSGTPSAAPSGSAAASGQPGGSGQPGSTADTTITAVNIQFEPGDHTVPAGKDFTIKFDNNDPSIPHNVSIREGGATGPELWKGEIFPGIDSRVYQVTTPLKAGTYTFICDVHPTMTGTLVAK